MDKNGRSSKKEVSPLAPALWTK